MAKNNNAGNNAPEKKEKNIVLVKFDRSYTPYVKGEVAGFDKKFAEKLIDKGIASEFEE